MIIRLLTTLQNYCNFVIFVLFDDILIVTENIAPIIQTKLASTLASNVFLFACPDYLQCALTTSRL